MENNRVCPWWMGYMLLIPVRKLGQHPGRILGPHVKKGMNVLDYGCAMGYFSLPLAEMTGDGGSVYCVDIQEKMLEKLQKRAARAGLDQIIKPLQAGKTFNAGNLVNQIDFTLLFAVVHEVPDKEKLFNDLFSMTKSGGKVLFAEPAAHVPTEDFEKSLHLAKAAGFKVSDAKPISSGLSALMIK